MSMAIFGYGILCACFPVTLDQDAYAFQCQNFALPIAVKPSAKDRIASIRIWISEDRGKVWKQHAEIRPTVGEVIFVAPRDGHYWFRVQGKLKDGTLDPLNDGVTETLKVYINTHRFPVVRLVDAARPPLSQTPAGQQSEVRQLQREVRELRAIIETLRKKTTDLEKDRKPR